LGRFTTLTETTVPLGVVPAATVSGCQTRSHALLVQMNLPFPHR
jgi:hypothetical protein